MSDTNNYPYSPREMNAYEQAWEIINTTTNPMVLAEIIKNLILAGEEK